MTEKDIDAFDIKFPLEHQFQQQEIKNSGCGFDKNTSMTIYFYKTGEMKCRSHVKIPLRSAAILNIENHDENCFILSILAKLHTCKNNQPKRVSKYRQNFKELNVQGFDFTNEYKFR